MYLVCVLLNLKEAWKVIDWPGLLLDDDGSEKWTELSLSALNDLSQYYLLEGVEQQQYMKCDSGFVLVCALSWWRWLLLESTEKKSSWEIGDSGWKKLFAWPSHAGSFLSVLFCGWMADELIFRCVFSKHCPMKRRYLLLDVGAIVHLLGDCSLWCWSIPTKFHWNKKGVSTTLQMRFLPSRMFQGKIIDHLRPISYQSEMGQE
jgi:hypothetical protein